MRTILIADDEAHLRTLVRKTLEGDGYRMIEAGDGNGALELTRDQRPDLVILDWGMPGRTGLQVLRTLRREAGIAATPVIMLTARSRRADRTRAGRAGVRGYLVKPFSPLALIGMVEDVLQGGLS